MISVVTPWRTLLSAFGLIGRVKSEWVLMSIKPGVTARPSASMIVRRRGAVRGERRADGGDATRLDGDVGALAGAAAAVDHRAAADQDVVGHALNCAKSAVPSRATRGSRSTSHFRYSSMASRVFFARS